MSSKGHEPVRTCIVCGGKRPKRMLVRIAADEERRLLFVDMEQRAPGRGAYLCPECLPRLRFDKKVQRAFRYRAKGLSENMRMTPSA